MTSTEPERVFIALGANLGDRRTTLNAALADLQEHGDIEMVRCSSFHETAPVGGPDDQPMYLNAVAEINTSLEPRDLLQRLLEIETRHGRERRTRYGPRTLDLDLLLYGHRQINTPDLTVPHPRMWERDFVMLPLREICTVEYLQSIPRPALTRPKIRHIASNERTPTTTAENQAIPTRPEPKPSWPQHNDGGDM